MSKLNEYIKELDSLNFKDRYMNDFFLTWEKTRDELMATWTVADALRYLRENNISTRVFDSGLGIILKTTPAIRGSTHRAESAADKSNALYLIHCMR